MNNNNNPLGDFGDKIFEQFEHVRDTAVREVKSVPKVVKKQIVGDGSHGQDTRNQPDQQGSKLPSGDQDKKGKKIDPVTNKPIPSKHMVTQLAQATAQVAKVRMQKVREELEKQRLKITDEKQKLSPIETAKNAGQGPVMPEGTETEKATRDDAVAATLRSSKSTGENKSVGAG